MTAFDRWKDRYDRKWVTKEQLQRLVQLGVLTQGEIDEITGELVE